MRNTSFKSAQRLNGRNGRLTMLVPNCWTMQIYSNGPMKEISVTMQEDPTAKLRTSRMILRLLGRLRMPTKTLLVHPKRDPASGMRMISGTASVQKINLFWLRSASGHDRTLSVPNCHRHRRFPLKESPASIKRHRFTSPTRVNQQMTTMSMRRPAPQIMSLATMMMRLVMPVMSLRMKPLLY